MQEVKDFIENFTDEEENLKNSKEFFTGKIGSRCETASADWSLFTTGKSSQRRTTVGAKTEKLERNFYRELCQKENGFLRKPLLQMVAQWLRITQQN